MTKIEKDNIIQLLRTDDINNHELALVLFMVFKPIDEFVMFYINNVIDWNEVDKLGFSNNGHNESTDKYILFDLAFDFQLSAFPKKSEYYIYYIADVGDPNMNWFTDRSEIINIIKLAGHGI